MGRTLVLATALVLLTLLAYQSALNNKYVWDDEQYILSQDALRDVHGLGRIWTDFAAAPQYYPLVSTLFWIQYQLWNLDWAGYHCVNILLHGLNAALLWTLLRRLKVPGAWLAAAVFAVHPMHVESVAWITELKNVLSALFAILALLAYLRFDPDLVQAGPSPKRWRLYPLVLVLFAAALLSKSAVAPLAPALALLVWWRRGRIGLTDLAAVIPLVGLSAGSGLVTLLIERGPIGAAGAEWALSWPLRLAQAGMAVTFYAGKLLWPAGLSFFYPRWDIVAWRWLGWVLLAGWLGAALLLWAMRRRIGRGPVTAVLLFLGLLAPAAGFFNVYFFRFAFVSDHYQYFASVAVIVPVCAAAAVLWSKLHRRSLRIAMAGGLAAVVLTLGGLTSHRCQAFYDNESIWRDALRTNPRAFLALNNLAVILLERNQPDEAIELLNRAIEVKPDYFEALNNRGRIYAAKQLPDLAEADYQAALRYNSRFAMAYNNLGALHGSAGDRARAYRDFTNAIRCDERYAEAYVNRGNVLLLENRPADALKDYEAALGINPKLAFAYGGRGLALCRLGHDEQAIADFDRSIELDPRNANVYANRAAADYRLGRIAQAIADVEACRKLNGSPDPALLDGLNRLRAASSRTPAPQ